MGQELCYECNGGERKREHLHFQCFTPSGWRVLQQTPVQHSWPHAPCPALLPHRAHECLPLPSRKAGGEADLMVSVGGMFDLASSSPPLWKYLQRACPSPRGGQWLSKAACPSRSPSGSVFQVRWLLPPVTSIQAGNRGGNYGVPVYLNK